MSLTPEQREQLLEADAKARLRSAVEKLRANKPLTPAERKFIEDANEVDTSEADGDAASWPKWAKSKADAQRITGVRREILLRYEKAGCRAFRSSGKVNLHELRAWMEENDKRGGQQASPSIGEARIRVLNLQARKLEIEIAREEGKIVDVEVAHAAEDRCIAKARAVLVQKFETELPPKQDGMPAAKIAELNRQALDQIFAILGDMKTYE